MLSNEARTFLQRHVDSAELLDVLMILLREPEGNWTAQTLSVKIFSVPQAVQKRLDELVERGLAQEIADRPGAFRLSIADAYTRSCLDAVRVDYETNRAEVVNVLFRMKQDPISSFSQAFRLRSDGQ